MKLKSLLTAVVLFCFAVVQGQITKTPTVDEILAKYFANTGGLEKIKALKTRKVEGKMSMQGMDLPVTMFEKSPVKQKMVITFNGMEIIQAYDGTDAWSINPMAGGKDPVKMTDEEAKELKGNPFENDFIDYKKKGHEATLQGSEEVDGVKCYKIQLVKNKFNDKDDVTETHYFDAENFVPIMQSTVLQSGPGKGQEMKTYVSDYQDVKGIMVPFLIEAKVNGQTVQKITFEKVILDEPMDDSVFAFPKK